MGGSELSVCLYVCVSWFFCLVFFFSLSISLHGDSGPLSSKYLVCVFDPQLYDYGH